MEGKASNRHELWNRLENLDLDDIDSALRFSDRLATENGWSKEFSRRVIEEYKRFVFLSQVAGHPITPSDEVDQVWHLHLCYTRSYWEEMCGELLDTPLHHGPTRGGDAEREKFVDWYAKTLHSYRKFFAEEPPSEIWPASRERFSSRRFQRIDTSDKLVIPRKSLFTGAAATASVMLLAGCAEFLTDEQGDYDAGAIFAIVIIALIILSAVISFFKSGGGKGGGGGCGGATSWCGNDGGGCGGGGCGGGGCGS
ncbi:MAG: hypothetical protein ACI9MB_000613 [Verrucomicrobiales bacterium]|jgi:hypothetical protein